MSHLILCIISIIYFVSRKDEEIFSYLNYFISFIYSKISTFVVVCYIYMYNHMTFYVMSRYV